MANSVFQKGKSAVPPLFNGVEVLSSASDKAKLFAKNFFEISNLGISIPVFSSRTNLKLHNIFVTLKVVKKVIMNLDSSKGSGKGLQLKTTTLLVFCLVSKGFQKLSSMVLGLLDQLEI